ncbi:Sybindin-like family protein [Trichodelitschia bisporula]|uniref:Trafficking protein particle complex subunit n=1 Tax=Trichodelitschia bisporula TaxID=703511 RepID=A0A6G1HWY9_9PEZI|nr:Sybindin-like family protein [Trichodelitschia bisporula]
MVVFSLLIINKAGGLVYSREFHAGLAKLSSNDLLILAGTFHGVHAITRSLVPDAVRPVQPSTSISASTSTSGVNSTSAPAFPVRPSGLEVLESSHFRLTCFQTLTGTKFLLLTEPAQPNVDVVLKKIYELYADYVMKNPFYTVEMPIRCQKFDTGLDAFVRVRG